MEKGLVTAIVTSYKRKPAVVERALKSVLNQTYKNIEIIVVDDSPVDYEFRDAVRDTVAKYGDKVRYIRHKKNMGACMARNTGIDNAKGEYIAFLDDDDVWREEKLELQIEKAEESGAGLIYCGIAFVYERTGKTVNVPRTYKRGNIYGELMKRNIIGGTSVGLVRHECFEKCGKFDIQQPAAQDYDMWSRIAEKYEVDYVDKVLLDYYVHAEECISKDPSKRIMGHERLLDKHSAYLNKNPKVMAIRKRNIAQLYGQGKRFGKMVSSLICAYFKDPLSVKLNIKATKSSFGYYRKAAKRKKV